MAGTNGMADEAANGAHAAGHAAKVNSDAGRTLAEVDPRVYEAIVAEEQRLRETIQLIPSENYPSQAVMEATGSVMTTKYAEGYPKRRYYQGCKWVDVVEDIARKRACRLFGAD